MTKEETYSLIFGGGAIRGLAYIGAIKAIQELELKYDTIVGSSVGAIVATLLALGHTYLEIRDIFIEVNFELFKDIHFGIGKNFALSKGEIFTSWMRENIERKFYGKNYIKGKNKPVTFENLDINLLVYTTDLISFKCKEFSKELTPNFEIAEAVRISCSMPGLMTPTDMDGMKLVDGDLLKSMPLWKLSNNLKLSTNRIMEFRLEGEYTKVENNAIDFFNAIYSCMTSAATEYIISNYGDSDDFDYVKINTGDVIIVDFNMNKTSRNSLIESGYQQVIDYLKGSFKYKNERLVKEYKNVLFVLIRLMDYIKSDKVVESKFKLGALFIILFDLKDIFSNSIITKISDFNKEFTISSNSRTWYGKPCFKEKTKLLKSLTKIIYLVNSRIEKLS